MLRRTTGMEFMKVPDKEMENFIKVATQTEEDLTYLQPEEINLKAGTRIHVIGGVFDGAEGYFVKVKGKRNMPVTLSGD